MSDSSIEWTDKTWQTKTAAKRLGLSVDEYLARRRSGEKHCWKCRTWRPIEQFCRDSARSDGHAAICAACRRPPKQLCLIRETPAERDRRRYATDPEYRLERRNHACLRRRGVALVPPEGAEAMSEKYGSHCAYCQARQATTYDHIVPVCNGGRTVPGNMVPACVTCNSRKRSLSVWDFIAKYGIAVSNTLEDDLALALEWGQLE